MATEIKLTCVGAYDNATDTLLSAGEDENGRSVRMLIPGALFGPLVLAALNAARSRALSLSRTSEELPLPLHDATAMAGEGVSVGIHLQFRNDWRLAILVDRSALNNLRSACAGAETLMAETENQNRMRH